MQCTIWSTTLDGWPKYHHLRKVNKYIEVNEYMRSNKFKTEMKRETTYL